MQQTVRGRPPLPKEQRRRTITCYLELGTIARLDHLAQAQGRARNELIKEALGGYLLRSANEQETE